MTIVKIVKRIQTEKKRRRRRVKRRVDTDNISQRDPESINEPNNPQIATITIISDNNSPTHDEDDDSANKKRRRGRRGGHRKPRLNNEQVKQFQTTKPNPSPESEVISKTNDPVTSIEKPIPKQKSNNTDKPKTGIFGVFKKGADALRSSVVDNTKLESPDQKTLKDSPKKSIEENTSPPEKPRKGWWSK
jgi:hypothetical protein